MKQEEKKVIIGISGEIASGKDTVARYYQKKYNAGMYRFSEVLRDILHRLYLAENRRNLADASLMLRKTFGEDVFARAIAEQIREDTRHFIIIDGVRRRADVSKIESLPGFRLLHISADPKKRHERLADRKQNVDDGTKTYEEFLADAELESELEIRELSSNADFLIENNGTLEELYAKADRVFEEATMIGGRVPARPWSGVWQADAALSDGSRGE